MTRQLLFLMIAVSTAFKTYAMPAEDSLSLKAIPHPLTLNSGKQAFTSGSNNAFALHAGKGTDLYSALDGSFYAHNVPMLLFRPDSSFIFSLSITPQFNALYDGGALLLYTDSSNWAKIIVEQLENGKIMLGSSVVRDRVTDDNYYQPVTGGRVYLKAVRKGNIYGFYSSVNGSTWTLIRTFSFARPENLRIGVYAQSPKGDGLTLHVNDVNYRAQGFKDFSTGE